MADDPRVDALLEELLDSGATPEVVCRDCTELLPQVREGLRRLRLVEDEVGALFPPSDTPQGDTASVSPTDLPQIPGYEVQGLLGHGGMGVVYKAWHRQLNRPVALKMLLAGPYARSHELERFLREAEAVARLRHPNVVQVYDVGDAAGRPYFTMEFVEGGSLAQKLTGTPQPAGQAAALVATLAEAIEVAHQSGIVHRDLTPANILLNADGTPKITDFGLARRLDGGGGLTVTGIPVGTPSYMAPEQVHGKKNAIGPSTDVYALGGTLYEMLTGRPPFQAETTAATLQQVLANDPAPPSRLNPRVPRDLETICLKCLHKRPTRRYTTAAALAEDLRRFERREPIVARPAGRLERLAWWARRRPVAATVLAGSLLLAFALVGGLLFWAQQRAATVGAVQEDLRDIALLQDVFDWTKARAVLDRTQIRLAGGGPAELRQRVDRVAADLKLAIRIDDIRLNRTPLAEGRFNKAQTDHEYEETFHEAGLGEVGDEPTSVTTRIEASAVHRALVGGLYDWAVCATDKNRKAWLLKVAQHADSHPDPDAWENRVRQPEVWLNMSALAELARTAPIAGQSVQLLVAVGEQLQELGGDPTEFLKRVQKEHPSDFWANFRLGYALTIKKDPMAAVGYFRAALAIRPRAVIVCNNLSFALKAAGQLDEAIDYYRRAIQIDPGFAPAYNNLGVALKTKGRLDEAIDFYRQALQIDPHFAPAHTNLGNALKAKGNLAAAIDQFEQAIQFGPRYAEPHYNLGLAMHDQGRLIEAIGYYQQALQIDPKIAKAHNNLGTLLVDNKRFDKAIDHFQQAIDLDPKSPLAHGGMGEALLALGRYREAQAAFRRCLDLLSETQPLRAGVQELLLRCEQRLALESRLSAVVEGKDQPATDVECLEFAEICAAKKQYLAAARLFSTAFAGSSRLAESLVAGHRYSAACAAALAGGVDGAERAMLGEEDQARWRKQARDWLRADLAAWAMKPEKGPAADRTKVRQTLLVWRTDPELAGLRDPAALEKLPPSERQECRQLWSDVDALLTRAGAAK